mmetsp:Transcript_28386/g.52375  ORF Transcript_28386/g.52375 Transcript_28386/m.52375 type:complete len:112 (-) Transcript_28386:874-1209(-)
MQHDERVGWTSTGSMLSASRITDSASVVVNARADGRSDGNEEECTNDKADLQADGKEVEAATSSYQKLLTTCPSLPPRKRMSPPLMTSFPPWTSLIIRLPRQVVIYHRVIY